MSRELRMKGRGRGAMLGARANGGDGWKTASFSQTQPIERARNGKLGTTFASLLTGETPGSTARGPPAVTGQCQDAPETYLREMTSMQG